MVPAQAPSCIHPCCSAPCASWAGSLIAWPIGLHLPCILFSASQQRNMLCGLALWLALQLLIGFGTAELLIGEWLGQGARTPMTQCVTPTQQCVAASRATIPSWMALGGLTLHDICRQLCLHLRCQHMEIALCSQADRLENREPTTQCTSSSPHLTPCFLLRGYSVPAYLYSTLAWHATSTPIPFCGLQC